jgi:hypothetical protein
MAALGAVGMADLEVFGRHRARAVAGVDGDREEPGEHDGREPRAVLIAEPDGPTTVTISRSPAVRLTSLNTSNVP